jgi:hypothetical protein
VKAIHVHVYSHPYLFSNCAIYFVDDNFPDFRFFLSKKRRHMIKARESILLCPMSHVCCICTCHVYTKLIHAITLGTHLLENLWIFHAAEAAPKQQHTKVHITMASILDVAGVFLHLFLQVPLFPQFRRLAPQELRQLPPLDFRGLPPQPALFLDLLIQVCVGFTILRCIGAMVL